MCRVNDLKKNTPNNRCLCKSSKCWLSLSICKSKQLPDGSNNSQSILYLISAVQFTKQWPSVSSFQPHSAVCQRGRPEVTSSIS